MDDTTKRPAFNRRDDGPAPNPEPAQNPGPAQNPEPGPDFQAHGVLWDPAVPVPTAVLAEAPTEVQDVTETDDWDEEDTDLLPAEGRSVVNRWTIGLIAAVLMVASFGAGAYAQRSTGSSTTAAAGAGGLARPGGYGQFGGLGGLGAPGGQGAAGQTGQGTGQGGTAAPVVVGQVVSVSGTTLTVKNFAGATVKVTVPAGTAVSVTSTVALSGLKPGTSVSITGTRGSDGTVSATGVTARAAAKQ